MRRKSWFRPFATLLAFWLSLVIGEPGVLHLCPTHGGVATVASTVESGPAAHDHGASVPQAAATVSQGSTNHESTPGHDHHNCSCISSCVGSAAAAPARESPTTTFVVAVHELGAAQTTVALLPRPAPEFSRPYTTGPPRV